MSGSLRCVWGSRFWVWMKWGNLAGSRIKKTGVLLNTQSRLPSSVLILIANPRGSRAVSADPDSPPTVEKRTVTGASLPTWKVAYSMVQIWWWETPYLAEESSTSEIGDIMCYFNMAMSTRALGVHDTFRDTFTVEVGQQIEMVEI